MKHLQKAEYQKSEADPCVVYKRDCNGELWESITIDDLLVVGLQAVSTEAF